MPEQRVRLIERTEHRLGHAVVKKLKDPAAVERGVARKKPRGPTLDAPDRFEAASVRDIGRLGGPRRNRPQARHDEQHATATRGRGLAVLKQLL